MKENIAELSRGWCIVEKSERREKQRNKRQAMMMGILTLGNLIIPAINLMIENYKKDNTINHKMKSYFNNAKKETKETRRIMTAMEEQIENIKEMLQDDKDIVEIMSETQYHHGLLDQLGMTDKESIVMKTLFSFALKEYSRMNLTEENLNQEGLPGFNLPHDTYSLNIKVIKNEQQRCNNTNITISARAIIPSEECLEIVAESNEVLKLRTKDGYCATTGSNRLLLKDGTWFAPGNFLVGTCNTSAMNIESNKNNILLSPKDQGEAKVTCGKESYYFTTRNHSYFLTQPPCSAIFRSVENRKSSKKNDYFARRTKMVSSTGKELRYMLEKQDSIIFYPFEVKNKNSTIDLNTRKKEAKVLLEAINRSDDMETPEKDDDFLNGNAVIGMLLGGAMVIAVAVAYMKFIYRIKNVEETNGLTYLSNEEDEGEEGIAMALIKTEDELTTRNTSNVKIENNELENTNFIMTDKEESTTVKGELMTNNFEKEDEEENEPWLEAIDKIKIRKEDGCYEDLMAEIREEWKRRNNK